MLKTKNNMAIEFSHCVWSDVCHDTETTLAPSRICGKRMSTVGDVCLPDGNVTIGTAGFGGVCPHNVFGFRERVGRCTVYYYIQYMFAHYTDNH